MLVLVNKLWPSQAMSLEVEEVLHSEKYQFQDILIFQRSSRAASYGSCTVAMHTLCR